MTTDPTPQPTALDLLDPAPPHDVCGTLHAEDDCPGPPLDAVLDRREKIGERTEAWVINADKLLEQDPPGRPWLVAAVVLLATIGLPVGALVWAGAEVWRRLG